MYFVTAHPHEHCNVKTQRLGDFFLHCFLNIPLCISYTVYGAWPTNQAHQRTTRTCHLVCLQLSCTIPSQLLFLVFLFFFYNVIQLTLSERPWNPSALGPSYIVPDYIIKTEQIYINFSTLSLNSFQFYFGHFFRIAMTRSRRITYYRIKALKIAFHNIEHLLFFFFFCIFHIIYFIVNIIKREFLFYSEIFFLI